MTIQQQYETTIIGGGLAGLALSIQLAKLGHNVALFEKELYPFHKVCGEYISMESWDFLKSIGLPLSSMQLPLIKKLLVTAPNGTVLQQGLPLGGFGISRYSLDNELRKIAISAGVSVYENCKVEDIVFEEDGFHVQTSLGKFHSKTCCGCFGKKSNLDIKWNRDFSQQKPGKLNNFIGIKYHIKTDHPEDTIALHNFNNGYCGISKVDNGWYCLCYLTNAKNLKDHHNSIEEMERAVLYKNPHLKRIMEQAERSNINPLTISQISFAKKTQVENHVLLLGDAAGMITPLCGNGMSMALHASKIATGCIDHFLKGVISRAGMEQSYTREWKKHFSKRLRTGRMIQRLFGQQRVTNAFIAIMKRLPGLTNKLIRQTHGKPF